MTFFLGCLSIMIAGGVLSCFAGRNAKLAGIIGSSGIMAGTLGALPAAVRAAFGGMPDGLTSTWTLPLGSFSIGMDSLSGFFLCAILVLAMLCAFYGAAYGMPAGRNPGDACSWLWLSLLVLGMVLVVVARNAILFLLAWEIMSFSSFFLVAFENRRENARRAAWIYLLATHLGSAFLLVMFVLMGAAAGSYEYSDFSAVCGRNAEMANVLFLLAVIGFGTKAGFFPLHVWLPEAHPEAPSHVSALMSGVMIKTGIYALLRAIVIFGPPPVWWGWLITAIGATSGILGVVFALAQHDLKRLLAYHSVENIGIIAMGIGLGMVGWSCGSQFMMSAGFAGAILHVVNHAVFKGLLFLAAGSVLHAGCGRNIEKMGGLLKRMPATGMAFFTGSAAICGLPPLNGFVSEFLIYAAAFAGVLRGQTGTILPGIAVIGALALIGGLATACFTKAFGMVFLGEPRGPAVSKAHECGWGMRLPMLALSAACLGITFAAPFVFPALHGAIARMTAQPPAVCLAGAASLETALAWIASGAGMFLGLLFLAVFARHILLRKRPAGKAGTWDCGFADPSSRMQYTASSYAQPITGMFRRALDTRTHADLPAGFFPAKASFSTHTDDTVHSHLFAPLFRLVNRAMDCLRWIQEGRVQVYVLYIALVLLALLLTAL